MMANAKMQDVKLITMQFQVNVKSAQQENIAHKDQLEVVRAKNQMVKHVMLILSAKVGHVVQNAMEHTHTFQTSHATAHLPIAQMITATITI